MNPITLFLAMACVVVGIGFGFWSNPYYAAPFILLAIIIWMSVKMANTWECPVQIRSHTHEDHCIENGVATVYLPPLSVYAGTFELE